MDIKKSNNLVFNSYLNLLLDDRYTKKDIYDFNKFDIWFCSRGRNFNNGADNALNVRLDKLFEDPLDNKGQDPNILYLSNLGGFSVDNVFSEDGLPSEKTYQEELNIPVSAYIFSKMMYPTKCKVNRDYNYVPFEYVVDDGSLSDDILSKYSSASLSPENNYGFQNMADFSSTSAFWNKNSAAWSEISGYFGSDYNFSSGYLTSEYSIYNVNRDLFVEDQINIVSPNSNFDILPASMVGGALFITWDDGERIKLYKNGDRLTTATIEDVAKYNWPLVYDNYPAKFNECIPVCYMELPKTYNLNSVKMNIQWSENGLFSLK